MKSFRTCTLISVIFWRGSYFIHVIHRIWVCCFIMTSTTMSTTTWPPQTCRILMHSMYCHFKILHPVLLLWCTLYSYSPSGIRAGLDITKEYTSLDRASVKKSYDIINVTHPALTNKYISKLIFSSLEHTALVNNLQVFWTLYSFNVTSNMIEHHWIMSAGNTF